MFVLPTDLGPFVALAVYEYTNIRYTDIRICNVASSRVCNSRCKGA